MAANIALRSSLQKLPLPLHCLPDHPLRSCRMDDRTESVAAFRDELNYLREAGQSFANQHPKLAERLELSREGSADPHVERLIESFAFLTSRIQRRLDSEFPEFTSALLGLLYPNLVNPIPPMTLARIVADPARGKLTSGYNIPRHT